MVTFSPAFQAALVADNPQRVLFDFGETTYGPFSNEHISVETGLTLRETFNGATDLMIGQTPSAEIQFDLLNDDYWLENFTFGTFTAYLGVRIDSGTPTEMIKTFTEGGVSRTYAFTPLGVFIAPRPDIVRKQIISVSANDRMTLFDDPMPGKTDLGFQSNATVTALQLANALCSYVGVTLATQTFINSSLTLDRWPDSFDSATMREVIGWIAEAAASNARFNRSGQLELAWLNTTSISLTEHDYSETAVAWYNTPVIDNLHVRNENDSGETVIGTGSVPYLVQNNPFLRKGNANA